MLKHRLIFGTLMVVFFITIVLLDGWVDGSLTACPDDDKPLQGTMLCILIALLIIPAQTELSNLAAGKNMKILTPLSTVASILFATGWYWNQFMKIPMQPCLFFIPAFVFSGLLLCQYIRYGASGVLANCGASWFSIIYLGLLSSFILAIRIDFGPWLLLMFVFVVKFSDIGAYTFGKLFGRHKFSPKISPGKTWEGMAGAAAVAIIVSVLFAAVFDIMSGSLAAVFGLCFAFIGQLGDLVESMIKRDCQQKDSSDNLPGFGGILDVIDSPLFSAAFAYLFFWLCL